jgi:asparagine synthase (glutamine-hydrolysing)
MSIVLNLAEQWKNTASLHVLGCIHDFEQQSALASVQNIESWATKLKDLKGFYSLVKQEDNQVFAAVDHIRSRPLFYASNEQDFYLSDSAEWVRQQVSDTVMDEYAKAEFQLTGYVTGRDTLYKNVKQLQAGECLLYANNQLTVERYYTFEHSEPESYNEAALLAELDVVAKESIQRLISYANGRQIVIPLSGGYDSRLIATLIKEANYENVLTFTYGAKGNKEAAYSKIIADNLGLKWHFIEYTKALWKAAWQTEECKNYQLVASNWSSLAHIQDWLAVKIMKEQGLVESDAVFAPGHSGDMVAGSHIPSFIYNNLTTKYTKGDLIEHLFDKHYCLTNHENVQLSVNIFKEKIEKSINIQSIYSSQEFANECEKYNWENRQAKFIFNSVRVYEFYDFDWWIPLWDKDFVSFFEELPLPFRNHKWYVDYVQNKYLTNINSTMRANVGNASNAGFVRKLSKLRFIEKLGIRPLLAKSYRMVVRPKTAFLIETVFNEKDLDVLIEKGYTSNGQLVYFFLNEINN